LTGPTGIREGGVTGIEPEGVGAMDNIRAMPQLVATGDALAKRVDLTHLGRFVDVPLEVGS